jgi:deazaflavin-dependent oxidoreductase (nitroreductase family)
MNIWTRLFTRLHVIIYWLTRGFLGNRVGKQSVLLLNTVGRRTGIHRITTLSYYRDEKNYVLVASNWGMESHPDWYLNLMKKPCTTIQVKDKILQVGAYLTEGEEYERLWQLVTGQNDQYVRYQQGIKRRIPIVILTPIVTLKECE